MKLSLLEILALEMALWLGLWLYSDYLATLLTLIIVAIVFAILLIALVAEWIEPSRVPRRYFWIMAISVLAPLLTAGLFIGFQGGKLDFLQK